MNSFRILRASLKSRFLWLKAINSIASGETRRAFRSRYNVPEGDEQTTISSTPSASECAFRFYVGFHPTLLNLSASRTFQLFRLALTILITFLTFAGAAAAQQPKPSPTQAPAQQQPQFEEWSDDFSGDKLNEEKWEKFTFEGASGGKLEVKDGQVQIRGASKTRAGIRSKKSFSGDRWIAEAQVAKVGAGLPERGSNGATLGFAALTILFDGSGRNRIEWILTSEGTFEAWSVVDGRGERLDNRNLGTKMKNPVLSVVRRGDEFLFVLNSAEGKPEDAQVGLKATVKNLPKTFHLMLYGYGSSENNWDRARVVVAK